MKFSWNDTSGRLWRVETTSFAPFESVVVVQVGMWSSGFLPGVGIARRSSDGVFGV